MSERPVKRLRRLSTEEDDDVSGNDDWIPEDVKARSGVGPSARSSHPTHSTATRPRTTRGVAIPASAHVQRASPSSSSTTGQRSIRLTVKAPPSKLRAVTTGSQSPEYEKRPTSSSSTGQGNRGRDTLARGSKNRPAVVEREDDDDEEEDDEEENEMDVDSDAPVSRPASRAKSSASASASTPTTATANAAKPSLTFRIPKKPGTETKKPIPEQALKIAPRITSVEDKEMSLAAGSDDDDEELSELDDEEEEGDQDDDNDEEEEDEDDDDEEEEEEDQDPDAEGESDDDMNETAPPSLLAQLQAAASASDSDSSPNTSRTSTPDPSRLTRRQRGAPDNTLLALSNEATKKKFLTAEQLTMRKAEMARRRKDLSEKRAREEKDDTLKRLLTKQVSKKKGGMKMDAGEDGAGEGEEGEEVVVSKARPGWVRCVIGVEGTRVGVPEEWLGKPVGRVFEGGLGVGMGTEKEVKVVRGTRWVQEVE